MFMALTAALSATAANMISSIVVATIGAASTVAAAAISNKD